MIANTMLELNNKRLKDIFIEACRKGDLNCVKYILTDESIDYKKRRFINIYHGFKEACNLGHFNIVEYLLTSNEIPIKIDLLNDSGGFFQACQNNHHQIIDLIMNDPVQGKKITPDEDYIDFVYSTILNNPNIYTLKKLLNHPLFIEKCNKRLYSMIKIIVNFC